MSPPTHVAKTVFQRWAVVEAVPLLAMVSVAVGMGTVITGRYLTMSPDVRIKKDGREAGLLHNDTEGQKFKDHALRRYVLNHSGQIFGTINKTMSKE
mmetsp:Transcript_2347/g.8395  ORF Transcript_2347/g.8395 Transcript_2347/m.8395 type:complete len:97 (-) Transcript_2347:127-417(-)